MTAHDFLTRYREYFSTADLSVIQSKLKEANEDTLTRVAMADYVNPGNITVAAFFNADKFVIGETGLGIAKVITGGGFLIWWLIDLIKGKKQAYQHNMSLFLRYA